MEKEMNELKSKILDVFKDIQTEVSEHDGQLYIIEDEFSPLVSYKETEERLGVSKSRLQIEFRELRDAGFIYLIPAVDYDHQPNGSAWGLTEKGLAYLNHLITK